MKNLWKSIVKKIENYSLLDIIKFFINFILTFLYSAITLYLALIFQLGISLLAFNEISPENWRIIIIGAFSLVILTYIRERIITKEKEQVIMGKNIAFRLIQSAIECIAECNMRSQRERNNSISTILKTIEHAVSVALYDLGLSSNHDEQICANIMVKNTSSEGDILKLKFWGTKWGGREEIILPLNENNIIPGAPKAFFSDRTIYIKNTMSRTYKQYFDSNKPYRSIVSIPIHGKENRVFCILNIDSDEVDKFGSKDRIDKKILPTLNPYFSLLKLMEKSIIK